MQLAPDVVVPDPEHRPRVAVGRDSLRDRERAVRLWAVLERVLGARGAVAADDLARGANPDLRRHLSEENETCSRTLYVFGKLVTSYASRKKPSKSRSHDHCRKRSLEV